MRRLAQGLSDDVVVEKLKKETASVGKGNLGNLRLRNIFRFKSTLLDLYSEFLERMGEEKSRHGRIPESFSFSLSYIIFLNPKPKPKPEKDLDSGENQNQNLKTYGSKTLSYPYDEHEQEQEGAAAAAAFVAKVVEDFANELSQNGVVTRLNFVVKKFKSCAEA